MYYGDLELPNGSDSVSVKSTGDCCSACDSDERCYFWSYGLASDHKNKCYLKGKNGGTMKPRPHFISGYATVRESGHVEL